MIWLSMDFPGYSIGGLGQWVNSRRDECSVLDFPTQMLPENKPYLMGVGTPEACIGRCGFGVLICLIASCQLGLPEMVPAPDQ